ncbi:MAG: NHL domain-containing protein [Vulcanimicrobiaceae bacterium]
MKRTVAALVAVALMPTLLAVTVTTPGAVTTLVNPRLFTQPSGDQHLHGIVRDPVSGDIYVGDWNALSVGITPLFGPYIENKDSIRRINALKEVSVVTYMVSPNALAYSAADRKIYVVIGSVSCKGEASASAPGPTLNGIVALDPATGKARVLSGARAGSANGSSTQARFSGPVGIASDPASGAFFVSEGCENRIREVDASGNARTLAGSGVSGNADGIATGATFNDPHGIAYCDHDRLLYVADTGNNMIRAVSLDGKVSTLAGSPEAGFVDANGAAARFNHPTGVACDNSGNVYVADSLNHAVRKVTSSGVVTTVAGNGSAGTVDGVGVDARFSTPGDITFDPFEHALYVVDWASNNVRKVTLGVSTAPH